MSLSTPEGARTFDRAGGLAASPWPKFRADARNSGCSPGRGAPEGRIAWHRKLGERVLSPPSIGADGTLYVLAQTRLDGRPAPQLVALAPDGGERWRLGESWLRPDDAPARSEGSWAPGWDASHSPAVAGDGTVYVGASPRVMASVVGGAASHLLAVDPHAGRVRGHVELAAPMSSPSIGGDGTVYVGLYRGGVAAIGPGGLLWRSHGRISKACACPALGPDGAIYHGSRDEFSVSWDSEGYDFDLTALDRDGEARWCYGDMAGQPQSPMFPAVGRDAAVYAVLAGRLYAFSYDGNILWRRKALALTSYPAVAKDATLRAAGRALHSIRAEDGTPDWTAAPCGRSDLSDPAIDGDETVYVGSRAGLLAAVDPSGEPRWCRRLGREPAGASVGAPIVGDGAVYAGTSDGHLYALT